MVLYSLRWIHWVDAPASSEDAKRRKLHKMQEELINMEERRGKLNLPCAGPSKHSEKSNVKSRPWKSKDCMNSWARSYHFLIEFVIKVFLVQNILNDTWKSLPAMERSLYCERIAYCLLMSRRNCICVLLSKGHFLESSTCTGENSYGCEIMQLLLHL